MRSNICGAAQVSYLDASIYLHSSKLMAATHNMYLLHFSLFPVVHSLTFTLTLSQLHSLLLCTWQQASIEAALATKQVIKNISQV